MSQPIAKVRGMKQDLDKKEKNEKPKHSSFLLTINTNQKPDVENIQNDMEILDDTTQQILNNIQNYIKLPDPSDWDNGKVTDVNIDYSLEQGEKFGRLHLHILLRFTHFSKIQLDYEAIKKKINEDLGLHNIYLYNRLVRNNGTDSILDYLKKMT